MAKKKMTKAEFEKSPQDKKVDKAELKKINVKRKAGRAK